MNTFKGYIKKELLEGIRTQKFIILGVVILFFAIADPMLIKLMPNILKSQFGDMDISAFVEITQEAAMQQYTQTLYQIVTFVIVLTLMGIVSSEIKNKTLVIPVTLGCSSYGIIISKVIIYSVYLFSLATIGMVTAYYYSRIIFEGEFANYLVVFRAGLLYRRFRY